MADSLQHSKIDPLENLFPPLSSGEQAADVNPAACYPISISTVGATFQREEYSVSLIEDLTPLLVEHWKEIATHSDIPLKPIWACYQALHDKGMLRAYTIRHDGRLIGYSVYTVSKSLHYGDSLQANNDVIWLAPALRGRMTGFRFIKWCDAQLKADGVQRVVMHIKVAHNWGPTLAKFLGYEHEEVIYSKRLDI